MIKKWKDVSIANKLYAVVGVMTLLVACELLTLRFAMQTLSAVRAFVDGEGRWSKAQKNAALSLQKYAAFQDERDYQQFLEYLKIPEGDYLARTELEKKNPDLNLVTQGFLAGNLHPQDIPQMIRLLQNFYWIDYLERAIHAWTKADELLDEFKKAGKEYHHILTTKTLTPAREAQLEALYDTIYILNDQLTVQEDEFSKALGEGSRWLENIVISLLIIAVLLIESIGITLTFLTSRSITRRLKELTSVATSIGEGRFQEKAKLDSKDEIGVLSESVNQMGEMLQASYGKLEQRVRERTSELEKLVSIRDEFLSIASHELKTPLTSLKLQTQLRLRSLQKMQNNPQNLMEIFKDNEKQINRLVRLVDEMLDVSKLNAGRLTLNLEDVDLKGLVEEVLNRLGPSLQAAKCETSSDCEPNLIGYWDHFRLEQVLNNFLSNAIKYANGSKIHIHTRKEGNTAILSVKDEGSGIAEKDQQRIFQLFERAVTEKHISGLGLGLYIIQSIVETHGGVVSVKSELGKGSEFTVKLPLQPSEPLI